MRVRLELFILARRVYNRTGMPIHRRNVGGKRSLTFHTADDALRIFVVHDWNRSSAIRRGLLALPDLI